MAEYLLIGTAVLAGCLAISTDIFVSTCRDKSVPILIGCLTIVLLWPVLIFFFVIAVISVLRRSL